MPTLLSPVSSAPPPSRFCSLVICFTSGHPCYMLGSPPTRYHKVSGLLPTNYTTSCNPRLLSRVSLHREPSILSSGKIPEHSTNTMVPFSRVPLNVIISPVKTRKSLDTLSSGWISPFSSFHLPLHLPLFLLHP